MNYSTERHIMAAITSLSLASRTADSATRQSIGRVKRALYRCLGAPVKTIIYRDGEPIAATFIRIEA